MRRKDDERREAIRLRSDGMSIRKIAETLGVALASVSIWTREVSLTDEQKMALRQEANSAEKMKKMQDAHSRRSLERRERWQKEGKEMAVSAGPEFIAGCMLYWAEGTKGCNDVQFANSDVEMVKFFVRFLRQWFGVKNDDIKIFFALLHRQRDYIRGGPFVLA